MATKTKAVDADIDGFYARVDMTIEPPLPDHVASQFSGQVRLVQNKDEDVVFDPVEGIKVVSNSVTQVVSGDDPDGYQYGYSEFKKSLVAVAKLATDNGSVVKGQVIVRDGNGTGFYRLTASARKINVERAALAWSDGTTSPFPEGAGA